MYSTCITLPKITELMISGFTLPVSKAARAAISARSVAVNDFTFPPYAPIAVLWAATTNTPLTPGEHTVSSSHWQHFETINFMQTLRKEMFHLTKHSTHFIYGYMASDIWLRTIPIVRKETRCRDRGFSFRLTARVLLYAPSHRQDSTYHGLLHQSWSTGWNEK